MTPRGSFNPTNEEARNSELQKELTSFNEYGQVGNVHISQNPQKIHERWTGLPKMIGNA